MEFSFPSSLNQDSGTTGNQAATSGASVVSASSSNTASTSMSSSNRVRRKVFICRMATGNTSFSAAAAAASNTSLGSALVNSFNSLPQLGAGRMMELSMGPTTQTASPLQGPQRFCTVLFGGSGDVSATTTPKVSFTAPLPPPVVADTDQLLPPPPPSMKQRSRSRGEKDEGAFKSPLSVRQRSSASSKSPSRKVPDSEATADIQMRPPERRAARKRRSTSNTEGPEQGLPPPKSPPKKIANDKSRSPTSTAMSKEIQDLFTTARYLKNWIPKLHGKKFIVEGDLIDFSQVKPGSVFPDRWKTSKIKGRMLANLITTSGSSYVLEGRLNYRQALLEAIPQFVIQAFANGFPENWESYREQWKVFNREQATNCNMSSNISVTSSMGNVSTFVRGRKDLPIYLHPLAPASLLPEPDLAPRDENDETPPEQKAKRPDRKKVVEGKVAAEEKMQPPKRQRKRREKKKEEEASKQQERPVKTRRGRSKTEMEERSQQDEKTTAQDAKEAGSAPARIGRLKKQSQQQQQQSRTRQRLTPKVQEKEVKQLLPKKKGRQTKKRSENHEDGAQGQQMKSTLKRAGRTRTKLKEEERMVETTRRVTRSQSPLKKRSEETGCEKAKAADAGERGKKKNEEAGGKAVVTTTMMVHSPPSGGRRQTRKQATPKRIVRVPQGDKEKPLSNSSADPFRHPALKKCEVVIQKLSLQQRAAAAVAVAKTRTTAVSASALARQPPCSAVAKAPPVKPPAAADLAKLVANPRTVKERARNARILHEFNANHADDIFEMTEATDKGTKAAQVVGSSRDGDGSARRKRQKAGRAAPSLEHLCDGNPAPNNIVSELFDSDSENDISLHSARTPIGNYFGRRSKSPVSASVAVANGREQEEEEEETPTRVVPTFKDHAFIHKKVQENKKMHKLYGTKPQAPKMLSPVLKAKKAGGPPVVDVRTAKMMNEINAAREKAGEGEDDEDGFEETYFSDKDDDDAASSLIEIPTGLLSQYQREQLKKRRQLV